MSCKGCYYGNGHLNSLVYYYEAVQYCCNCIEQCATQSSNIKIVHFPCTIYMYNHRVLCSYIIKETRRVGMATIQVFESVR